MISDALSLTNEDLEFFLYTCDLFPGVESPLRFLEDEPNDPDDLTSVYESLESRGLLNPSGSGASQELLDRLSPVSECMARVVLRSGVGGENVRNFFLTGDTCVEYEREKNTHFFGPARTETALALELAQQFRPKSSTKVPRITMSAGDYLVFAVFARDVREAPEPEPAADDAMSLEEVLAFFEEPETKHVQTPNDDSWNESVSSLTERGVLVKDGSGWSLHPSLHAVAREIVADEQHCVMRVDFLDSEWLVREVNLYPTEDALFRMGTEHDGSVVIQELTLPTLADTLAGVVTTLPNLLNPDVPSTLKGASVLARGSV